MKKILLSALFSFSLSLFAQDTTAIYYASSIKEADLEKHLSVLASDSLEGRETGQKGQKLAADYIARHFESIGIPPYNGESYYQEFPILTQKVTGGNLSINDISLSFLEDYYTLPYYGSTSFSFDEIQSVGFGLDEITCSDYRNIEIKDKVVLVFTTAWLNDKEKDKLGIDNYIDWDYQLEKAYAHGAKAVLFVGTEIKAMLKKYGDYFKKDKRSVLTEGAQYKIPFFFIDGSSVESLFGLSAKKMKKKYLRCKYASLKVSGKAVSEVESTLVYGENVLGYMSGTDLKEELLVITAHYDHIGVHDGVIHNGADDDGSGTVAILELAEAFAKAKAEGHGPRRSVLFMPVSGEEMGLLGSSFYSENPVFPLENTIADLNIDMIGRMDEKHEGNPDYVYLIGSDKLSTELHQVSEDANTLYTQMELDYTFNDPEDPNRFYYRSDHYNFAKHNIPVIFYFNGVHADYHKPTDTIEKIHFGKIANISKLIFHTAWGLLNQDKRIAVDVESDFKNNR